MNDDFFRQLEALIQRDVGGRGLARDLNDNLFTRTRGDLAAACSSLYEALRRGKLEVAIVTGFYIPSAAAFETDGPLGAVFLARVIHALGGHAVLLAEDECLASMQHAEGSNFSLLPKGRLNSPGHLIAIERAGPSHTPQSICRLCPESLHAFLAQIPASEHNRCHTMRGHDVTPFTLPLHELFETTGPITIGVGDGGNEIGMGKIPWSVIARSVPNGGVIACRVPTDHLIVCGVSNWGAYALAAGLWRLAGATGAAAVFDSDAERELWHNVLKQHKLVDGVTGQRELTVDGLDWETYSAPLRAMRDVL
jgi:hypothetical protein